MGSIHKFNMNSSTSANLHIQTDIIVNIYVVDSGVLNTVIGTNI